MVTDVNAVEGMIVVLHTGKYCTVSHVFGLQVGLGSPPLNNIFPLWDLP
jgi:hypothetical protein